MPWNGMRSIKLFRFDISEVNGMVSSNIYKMRIVDQNIDFAIDWVKFS